MYTMARVCFVPLTLVHRFKMNRNSFGKAPTPCFSFETQGWQAFDHRWKLLTLKKPSILSGLGNRFLRLRSSDMAQIAQGPRQKQRV